MLGLSSHPPLFLEDLDARFPVLAHSASCHPERGWKTLPWWSIQHSSFMLSPSPRLQHSVHISGAESPLKVPLSDSSLLLSHFPTPLRPALWPQSDLQSHQPSLFWQERAGFLSLEASTQRVFISTTLLPALSFSPFGPTCMFIVSYDNLENVPSWYRLPTAYLLTRISYHVMLRKCLPCSRHCSKHFNMLTH